MYQLAQTLHKTKGNPFFSAGLKKTEGTSSLRLFSKLVSIFCPTSFQVRHSRYTQSEGMICVEEKLFHRTVYVLILNASTTFGLFFPDFGLAHHHHLYLGDEHRHSLSPSFLSLTLFYALWSFQVFQIGL